jgi:hypothetical protein
LGGVTPRPRKESPADRMMLMLTRLVAYTRMPPSTFGTI